MKYFHLFQLIFSTLCNNNSFSRFISSNTMRETRDSSAKESTSTKAKSWTFVPAPMILPWSSSRPRMRIVSHTALLLCIDRAKASLYTISDLPQTVSTEDKDDSPEDSKDFAPSESTTPLNAPSEPAPETEDKSQEPAPEEAQPAEPADQTEGQRISSTPSLTLCSGVCCSQWARWEHRGRLHCRRREWPRGCSRRHRHRQGPSCRCISILFPSISLLEGRNDWGSWGDQSSVDLHLHYSFGRYHDVYDPSPCPMA